VPQGFSFQWRGLRQPLTVEDWRQRARKRVPNMVWAFVENGADDERTLEYNRAAFSRWHLRQRVMSGASLDASVNVLGTPLAMPLLILRPAWPARCAGVAMSRSHVQRSPRESGRC
jgi:hypothetical protein